MDIFSYVFITSFCMHEGNTKNPQYSLQKGYMQKGYMWHTDKLRNLKKWNSP